MKLKICGIRSFKDVELLNRFKPDFAGFIFYPPSFRYINKETALKLRKQLDPKIKSVGVYVDESPELIKDYYDSGIFDIAQLHGKEDPSMIEDLKTYGLTVIKSFRITDKDSFLGLKDYDPDYFLFDVFSKKAVGGSGESFDWGLLKNQEINKPFFLAGGVGVDNLPEALKTDAFAVDLSSSVETDGKKDENKIKEIMEFFKNEV